MGQVGRPRLPTELKILKGTLNTTRAKREQSADIAIANTSIIIQENERVPIPKTITTKTGKKFYKQVIENLKILHVLSKVDLTQIEIMTRYLERIHETDEIIKTIDITDIETLSKYSAIYDRLSTRFDNLATKFYITPSARVQLKLGELNAIKTTQEITINDNAISSLLEKRKRAEN